MRIVAALLVAAFHIDALAPFADSSIARTYHSLFGQGGWAGVTFFFVLSGFVLTWAARPADTAAGFWRRRLFKLYPNHVLVLAAGVLLVIYLGIFPGTGIAVANLFLVHVWDWRFESWWGVNPVSWSLCCEVFFYACFPLLIGLVNRVRPSRLWIWVVAVTAAIAAVPSLAHAVLPDEAGSAALPIGITELWFINGFPPVRTLDFLLGIFLARMVKEGQLPRLPLVPALAVAVGGYVLSTQVPYEYGLAACTALPFGLLVAAATQADLRGSFSPFRNKPMVWLGQISYAFYLWHYLVLMWLADLFAERQPLSTAGNLGFIALALTVVVLLSWATFRWVETPMMRRFAVPRRRRPATATSSPDLVAQTASAPLAARGEGQRLGN
ncbi:acyltransferase [Frankia sp. CNm7]|uniref:Acyltransferase n=1 Tax=Frankia nepalensis TaxID=1836974 RepID=A0A937RKW9_9ACTN|nr:acyltransferase [Frankia nepalensis]MBL7500810.1 acyltransferase [Frankia nepalensis]MBL7512617.1 acyltransferase [Frankia nepalensis]MBL7524099.1 acyltransferase [Frankia nepalensis]MBL7629214.1 acyltransferase [Frankia nepalensis]